MSDGVDSDFGDEHDVSSGLPQTVDSGLEFWGSQLSIDEQVFSHPLYSEPVIRTPQARNAYHECKERMRCGIEGFTVIGKPGMGRRGVVSVIRGYLHQEFPRLTTFEHAISRFPAAKPSEPLSGLLAALAGHQINGGVRAKQLELLADMLVDKIRASKIPLCVLFLHNSEFADDVFFQTLLDLRDSLRLRGVRIFFVHCALFELFMKRVRALYPKFRSSEIRSIFGTAYEAKAPESVKDYGEILSEIDTAPFGSAGNVTWTEALLPEAYRGGFRLASQAKALDCAIKNIIGRSLSVRMFFEVVRTVVAKSATQDAREFEIPGDIWCDAVRIVAEIGGGYLLES